MRKRITFFLALTAAVLLALPTQAQQLTVKKAVKNSQVIASKKLDAKQIEAARAARAKANDQTVGIAFRGTHTAAVESRAELTLEQAQALKAADTTAGKLFKAWNWKANQAPKYVSKSGLVNTDNARQPLFKFSGREVERFARFDGQPKKILRAETFDDHGIITAPDEGVTKYYTRTGTAFFYASGVYDAEQSGVVTIVECEDAGTVYIKDPISRYSQNSWVKGTKDGNTITVAGGQPLAWNANYSTTLGLYWANVQSTATGNTYTKGEGDITFTVDDEAGTITLDGSSQDKIIAVFWDDDNSWSGYGDYSTVWTLNTEYEPASTDPIVLPDGAEVQNWYADGTGSAAVPTDVMVAFVGNEVYISGLTSNFPDAWIKGTLDGTTVTFSKFQYVGTYGGTMPIWAVGADPDTGNLQDFTMTYDSEAQTLTLDANQLIVFNAAEDRMYYLSYIESLTIYAEEPAPAVIETLPYVNSFDTAAEQKHFTIIDANEDGRTWAWYSGMARYTYSQTNPGDDWLVSPGINLVAGKKYHFSVAAHAQSSSYPERFEVKAALENTAEALSAGAEVLPATDVTSSGFVTYENNEFTVTESGTYYIGVHAISDKDQYYFYLDDFVLEAAPITPDYVADFSTADAFGDFVALDANGDATANGNGTWNWSATNYAYYKYSSTNAADDYLILPIKLAAGKAYNVTVNAASNGSFYPEKFEVVWGTEPTKEAMTNVIIAETTLSSDVFADYTGSFTTTEAGTYYVAIHATSDADQFNLKVKSFAVEVGAEPTAPAAVSDFAATQAPGEQKVNIAFTAPTTSIDGNTLTDNLTKIEVLRNGTVAQTFEDVTPGQTFAFDDEVPTMGTYKYQVIPYNASGIGIKSDIIEVLVTIAVDVPYTVNLSKTADASVLDLFQVIDANGDNKTWAWGTSYGTYCAYSTSLAADDYLVSLPIKVQAGKTYDVIVNANAYSASYPERFEVKVGKDATVEGLTETVIPATDVTTKTPTDYQGSFTASEDGQVFVAIHGISDADSWYLIINSLSVEKGPEPNAPAAVDNFTVTAGAEGALLVDVSFVTPTTAINGSTLTNAVDAKIYRDGTLVNTISAAAPGSDQNWQDTDVENGKTYTYWVVCSDATAGDGLKSEKQSVFVGEDLLGVVPNVQLASTTASGFTLTWDPVEGQNGGYINQSAVTYEVYALELVDYGFFVDLAEGEKVAETTDLTATIALPMDEGEAAYHYYGVKAVRGEEATDATESYTYVMTGAPEELPIEEGFADKTLHYAWDSNGGLGVDESSSDEDGVALKLYNDGTSSEVYFVLPKVKLNAAANPTILFDAKNGTNVSKVKVIGSKDDAPYEVLGEFDLTADYTTIKQVLSSLKGATRFSSVGILATITTPSVTQYEDNIIIDNIRIMDLYEYDLSVAVTAPAKVQAGQSATIKATVKNEGENAADGYTIIIKAGDQELLNNTVNETLAPFATSEFEASFATTIFDDAADVTLTAEVVFENDLNEDNNSAETIISIVESSAAQPENLTGTQTDAGVELSWTAPENGTASYTEDVESYDEFATGGLGADVHTGKIGEWTVYDGNGTYAYGFDGLSVPNLGAQNAWIVMAPASTQLAQDLSSSYGAHSGGQYFISTCVAEPEGNIDATNHWLISPELPGVAQTISFFARTITAQYGQESFEVLASSTDTDPASFTSLQTFSTDATEWTEFSVELPEGSKYFAIRHTSTDVFGLMVDDITYLVGGGDVESYNIYVDGELAATVTGDVTTYIIDPATLTSGDHQFAVSAVYTNGSESKPVEVTISVTTAIDAIKLAEGKAFDVYTLDGKQIRHQVNSLDGLKGVYVINGKAVLVK